MRVRYLHSDIETVERTEIIRDLRLGEFDVLVGINLLREGLDMPEVSLVAIFDADKEGFLRSEGSLIQTIGRAARNVNGKAILYADRITGSMQRALEETERRRAKQIAYNEAHGVEPKSIMKAVQDIMEGARAVPRGRGRSAPRRREAAGRGRRERLTAGAGRGARAGAGEEDVPARPRPRIRAGREAARRDPRAAAAGVRAAGAARRSDPARRGPVCAGARGPPATTCCARTRELSRPRAEGIARRDLSPDPLCRYFCPPLGA